MKTMKSLYLHFVFTAILLPLAIGCGGSDTSTNTDTDAPGGDAPATSDSGAIAPPAANPATVIAEGVKTAPAQSVAVFLDSLRRGDETAANGVLTAKAREELAKTAYAIQPLGTPEGQYKIGRVGFPYAEKDIALVECTWTEPPVGDEPATTMDIVCEVHQETEGWRISGIGVTLAGTDDALVLDFEDAASLQATIDAATGQAPTTSPQSQNGQVQPNLPPAGLPSGGQMATQTAQQLTPAQSAPQTSPPNPALPPLPSSNEPSAGGQTQIALPPNNGPIRR